MESTSARMNRIARNEMMLSDYTPLSKTLKQIDAVTPADISKLVNRIFLHDQLALSALGPVDKDDLKDVL